MHKANRLFWEYCQKKYSKYFNGSNNILEVGSYNVNGSVREHFTNFNQYIGIDWRPGPCVDLVCKAEDMDFDYKFDVVISASMLEHDPNWNKSLDAIIKQLKEDGILLLSWGAALNKPHSLNTAVDGNFHCLKAGLVINHLKKNNIYIHEFRYEGKLPFLPKDIKMVQTVRGAGMGEVCLVAFTDEKYSIGEKVIDTLLKEDCV